MQTTDPFRPRRQTMQNVKPTDYVPFEDAVRTSLYLGKGKEETIPNAARPHYPVGAN